MIPVYFLCKKYFDEKIALVGVALIAFDPRLILNSTLGITDPLFILLTTSSLVLLLKYERKLMPISFILASCATIVRAEGIFLFFTLSIIFFIKYKISKEILKTYIPCLVIFMLILIPIMDYRMEVAGYFSKRDNWNNSSYFNGK
jgi:4-amino-4-deoxy-L-arabinose transferase-like glycosyltransferase